MTRLSQHFTLEEFSRSNSHPELARGIPEHLVKNVQKLVDTILQPLRLELNQPIEILSGYRSIALNQAVGGSPTSQHTLAEAAELMADRGVGSLLVVERGALAGILTRTDLERAGLAEAAFGERRCSSCRSYHHVRADAGGYLLCARCRAARGRPDHDPSASCG